ncbi:methyltransferase domain-containing protein [Lacticaseibacillus baoqingensis]|uniref:Methyltransferase domain-containing protein n=1 Tax=Lacticaseibacillus baoqingensis TaxID=2486013 RepID=A0ABW4E3P5_9LACO|nr:methyltransferase domain-containing protein [Lacticaseibacillus baoqingensis]
MRKINQKAEWAAAQGPVFACPVCHEPLQAIETSLVCAAGHRFDLAKKGTVNFLNAPVKTEYTTEMLAARRRVLQAGLFAPFVTRIKQALSGQERLLDVGCGEGSPTAALAETGTATIGFDISAPAINLAGALETPAFFCVADLARLPFLTNSFDVLVDLFSPGAYAEFDRVLRPGGRLFKVIPATGYLRELREGLYSGTDKATYSNAAVKARFLQAYPDAVVTPISYDFPVATEQFADVVTMTPLSWQAPADKRQALLAAPPSSIHVDVELLQITLS